MSVPVRVLVAPKDENPYQQFLYEEASALGAEICFEQGPSHSQSLNLLLAPLMLVRYRVRGFRILHIHWIFQFSLPWARRAAPARLAMQWWFWFYLFCAKRLGFRIVWTAHDLLPHDPVFFDDSRARQYLIARSEVVIALSSASAAQLVELGAVDVQVIPFGSYADPYPRTLGREDARGQLGLGPQDIAVLLIGKIEHYKGADLLLRAAAALPLSSPVKVVVAGACHDPHYRASLSEIAREAGPRALVRLERIPDEEMAIYLDAADFAAFPFRSVTNSSSVLLAQSFGLPVIIPNLDSLSDVPKDCALRYDPSDEGLGRALEQAAELSAELRSDMASAARRHAHSMDWPTVAQLHLAVYAKVLRNRLQRAE